MLRPFGLLRAILLTCVFSQASYAADLFADGSIFDTSRMTQLVVSEVHKNGYFKTYFAKDKDTLVLVTDYRTTSLASPGSKITGTFIFVGLRKVLYRGTQYELPEYAVYENQKKQDR